MPVGVCQMVFLILTSGLASIIPSSRILLMILNTVTALVGMVMVYTLHGRGSRMTGLCLTSVFAANIPLSLSLVSSNVGGFTKRSVISATVFIAYCVGNIVGPQFFLASQEPRYQVRQFHFILSVGVLFRAAANTSTDWSYRVALRAGIWCALSHWPIRLLYLGESPEGQALRITFGVELGSGTGRGTVEQDGQTVEKLSLYALTRRATKSRNRRRLQFSP